MNLLVLKAQTALALGVPNLWRVLNYRLGVKLGINKVRKLQQRLPIEPLFIKPKKRKDIRLKANQQWYSKPCYFGWYTQEKTSSPPQWHQNPFNQESVTSPELEWWAIPDFNPKLGDIKTVWEASRFDWVITLVQHAAQGDMAALDRLNNWLMGWCEHNRAYKGVNWKCGQEASIRVMHLAIAATLLEQHKETSVALQQVIRVHLERIAPTISYAIAQDNNHGTSEAAALYIGGSWLFYQGDDAAKKYQALGLKWLENRATRLIEKDGGFSQYSTNYHRVMLDTYSMVEYWRRTLSLPAFSTCLYERLKAATNWLYQMTQPESGDAPNLGANDGARLLPLTGTDYRDYRPSVQLASVLFAEERAYPSKGDWNLPLQWLGIEAPAKCKISPSSAYFEKGGYSALHAGKAFVLLNIPRFRFRPSQADALHVDLWLKGDNLLRDAGTYSYNAGDDVIRYFGGTEGHNTIQFDGRDQMPRLSRFLLGAWLKAERVTPVIEKGEEVTTGAAYCDSQGAFHHRIITLSDQQLLVTDKISGFKEKMVLRWRLKPSDWKVRNTTISNGTHKLTVTSNVPIVRFEITEGWESRYYLQKTPLPVLEVEIHAPGECVTEYSFNQ